MKDTTPSMSVVVAVGDATDTPPVDLPPLYHYIDPDALDSLFNSSTTGHTMFEYYGYLISVKSDGEVEVIADESPAQPTDESSSG